MLVCPGQAAEISQGTSTASQYKFCILLHCWERNRTLFKGMGRDAAGVPVQGGQRFASGAVQGPGSLHLQHKLLKMLLSAQRTGIKKKKKNTSPCACAATPLFLLCLRQTAQAVKTLCRGECVCLCACVCTRLLVRFLLPCQNISCCLFIYFSLITEGIAFPEERQQMIRAQD